MSLVKKKNGSTVFHPLQNLQVKNKITMSHSIATDMTTSSSPKENPAACIFVASLNKNMDDEALNRSVFDHFAQWGKLLGVKVLKDWLRRPYAFVQYEAEEDSKKALQEAPGTYINGRSIRCEPARVNRSICLISFNQPFNKQFLQNSLSTYGELEDITIMQPHGKFHYIFVKFKYRDDAIKAYLALKCSDYSSFNNSWFVEWASNLDLNNLYGGSGGTSALSVSNLTSGCLDRGSIFVGNLPEEVTERDLRNQFRLYGKIFNTHLIRKPAGRITSSSRSNNKRVFAFIKYNSEDAAARAIDQENGRLWHEKVIRVSYREYYHNMNFSSPISNGGTTIALPHHYFYNDNPFLSEYSNKKQRQIMPLPGPSKQEGPHGNGHIDMEDHNGVYYAMPYCNPAATATIATIYDPYAYMKANSGIISSSAEKSSSFTNSKTSNMTTAAAAASTTTAGAFYAYNSKDNYYPYFAAAASAMVYYPYPPSAQPYYYNNGMCYGHGATPYPYQKTNGTHTNGTSSGQNGVTTV